MKAVINLIIIVLYSSSTFAQSGQDSLNAVDTAGILSDSSLINNQPKIKSYHSVISDLLSANKFINVTDAPVFFTVEKKKKPGKEFTFYTLCLLVLILGVFKTSYRGYFNNLFRVFFNTSLRQTQLTDQLLQAKLPSFILNIFFTLTAGIFIWLLFINSHPPRLISRQLLLPVCILSIGALYFIKYCLLKFIGWLSSMQQSADSYIFIIFLVNKISGIVLVPFIIILAFPIPLWVHYITTISLLVVILFFLSRYLKTYGVLGYKFPLNPFHFLIYITATEIVPLLILYKITIDYLL